MLRIWVSRFAPCKLDIADRPAHLTLPTRAVRGRLLSDHRGINHGAVYASDVIFANLINLQRGGADHRHVGFAQSPDRCPRLGQIILPQRPAVHRRIGRIRIQLAKCAGDSFQAGGNVLRIAYYAQRI